MKKVFLFLLALTGLPFLGALGMTLFQLLLPGFLSSLLFTPSQWCFVIGVVLMATCYWLWGRALMVTYAFAHEMTHAIAGVLCLAKIHAIRVGACGGEVELSKTNLFITLAPYCFPLYFLFLVFIRWLVDGFFPETIPPALWNILQGFMLAFHVLYTCDVLMSVGQPDVRVYGRFFSYWLILAANLIFLILALCVILPITFSEMLSMLAHHSATAYTWTAAGIRIPITMLMK